MTSGKNNPTDINDPDYIKFVAGNDGLLLGPDFRIKVSEPLKEGNVLLLLKPDGLRVLRDIKGGLTELIKQEMPEYYESNARFFESKYYPKACLPKDSNPTGFRSLDNLVITDIMPIDDSFQAKKEFYKKVSDKEVWICIINSLVTIPNFDINMNLLGVGGFSGWGEAEFDKGIDELVKDLNKLDFCYTYYVSCSGLLSDHKDYGEAPYGCGKLGFTYDSKNSKSKSFIESIKSLEGITLEEQGDTIEINVEPGIKNHDATLMNRWDNIHKIIKSYIK